MLLHNYIIDCRQVDDHDDLYFKDFCIRMDHIQQEVFRHTGEMPRALVTDNNEPYPGGRRSLDEHFTRQNGVEIRHQLTVSLSVNDKETKIGGQHGVQFVRP